MVFEINSTEKNQKCQTPKFELFLFFMHFCKMIYLFMAAQIPKFCIFGRNTKKNYLSNFDTVFFFEFIGTTA